MKSIDLALAGLWLLTTACGSMKATVDDLRSSGAGQDTGAMSLVSGSPTQFHSVSYCTAGGVSLGMTIVRPGDSAIRPLVVLIHGGGNIVGKRDTEEDLAIDLARQGFVAATIDYRLSSTLISHFLQPAELAASDLRYVVGAQFPASVGDSRCAVRYLRASGRSRSNPYGIDPSKIAVAGSSNGGNLALMVGLADADDRFLDSNAQCFFKGRSCNGESSRVQAVVDFFGPTSFLPDPADPAPSKYQLRVATAYFGNLESGMPGRAIRAGAINYVSSDDPPVLSIHGTADDVVSFGNSVHKLAYLAAHST